MALRRHGPNRTIIFECDECGDDLDTGTDDFNKARVELQDEGWRTIKNDETEEWQHYCPECE